jgi:hypothetical protein
LSSTNNNSNEFSTKQNKARFSASF